MPEGIITTAQNANAIATVVARRTLTALRSATAAYQACDPSYSNEVSEFGNTVNVPIPAEYSSNLMADGGTITRQNPSLGNAAIVLNKHREISWEHTDVNQVFATPNLQNTSLGQAIANMAEDIDADLLSIYASFTATAQGAYGSSITEPTVDGAETELFNQRAAPNLRRCLIVTGTGLSSIRQIPRFTEPDKAGGSASGAGVGVGPMQTSGTLMGWIKGFAVYRAQQTNVTNSGTNKHGIAMVPTALLVAQRRLGRAAAMDGTVQVEIPDPQGGMAVRMTWSYHHNALGGLSTLDVLYGYTSGRTNHGVEVKH